ncbi:MAG: hypothetical protein Kow00107_05190 [Planctomycetota bacterium]
MLVSALLLFTPVFGEEEAYCAKCKNTGIVKSGIPPELVGLPFKSSVAIEHRSGCFGLGWLPCPAKDCPHAPEARKEFEKLTEPLKKWIAERRASIDAKVLEKTPKLKGYLPFHAETAHFFLSGTFKSRKLKIEAMGKTKTISLNPVESFHTYCTRAENAYSLYQELAKFPDEYKGNLAPKMLLYVSAEEQEAKAVTLALCNFVDSTEGSMDAEKWVGYDDKDDLMLHHKMVSAVASLLTEDYGKIVLNEDFPVWFKEAACWWLEYRTFGEVRIFREGETELAMDFPASKLEEAVWKEAGKAKGRMPSLREAMDNNVNRLSGWHRIKNWSLIDWMVREYKQDSFRRLLLDFKDNFGRERDPAGAFRRVFDKTPEEIEEAWLAWVKTAYKPKR